MKKILNTTSGHRIHDWARSKYHLFIRRLKALNGDPHFIAMGMAVGVFVSFTPTIPFHTVLAIAIAYVLNGSKAAAAIGVWVSNPVTIPFFYYGCYKIGQLILGHKIPTNAQYETISLLLKQGVDVTMVMMIGGIVLGIVPGIVAYFVTRKLAESIRAKRRSAKKKTTV